LVRGNNLLAVLPELFFFLNSEHSFKPTPVRRGYSGPATGPRFFGFDHGVVGTRFGSSCASLGVPRQ